MQARYISYWFLLYTICSEGEESPNCVMLILFWFWLIHIYFFSDLVLVLFYPFSQSIVPCFSGDRQVNDGMAFAQQILDVAHEDALDSADASRVAILCAPNYDSALVELLDFRFGFSECAHLFRMKRLKVIYSQSTSKPHHMCCHVGWGHAHLDQCVHWIPGWLRSPDDPADLYDKIVNHSSQAMQVELDQLGGPPEADSDAELAAAEQASYSEQVFGITKAHDNLTQMQLHLWNEHSIASRGTVGDGNCGIETIVCLQDPAAAVWGEQAARPDMLDIFTAYRRELKAMWESVCRDVWWQKLWHRFVGNRLSMEEWKGLLESEPAAMPCTPPQHEQKQNRAAAVTPEKSFAPGKLLAIGEGEPELEEVLVAMGPEGEEPPKKRPKPTGKLRDPQLFITFDAFFPKYLAEKGMTYKLWLHEHAQGGQVLPCLGNNGRSLLVFLYWKLLSVHGIEKARPC